MSNFILLIPDWFFSVVLVASGPLLLVSLVLLGFAVGGRRDGNEIRCRRCSHEFERTSPIPDVCQECGSSTTARNALRLGSWRPRWRILVVAVTGVVLGPCLLALTQALPSMKAAAIRAGGIDVAIDQAIAQQQFADLSQLHEVLHTTSDDNEGTDAQWLRFSERIEREPAVRPLAIAYVSYVATWGGMQGSSIAASDKALEAFGRALATALKSDPALIELWSRELGAHDDLPAMLVEQLATDVGVLRAFLRGPVLTIKHVVRERRNELRVGLIHDGLSALRRQLAFDSVEVFYGRRDGTMAACTRDTRRSARFAPELDASFGTIIDLTSPIADPLWDGTIRIDARIGHTASNKFGRGLRENSILEDVFDHSWEIRVERVDPANVRVFPVSESNASELITASLRNLSVHVKSETQGNGPMVLFDMDPLGTVNGVRVTLDVMIEQEARIWPVQSGAENILEGFEIGRPFQLIVQGVAPKSHESVHDLAYLAGSWIGLYEAARRTPFEVKYTPDPKATVQSSQTSGSDGDSRRGTVVPGAIVGPKRPVAEVLSPTPSK